MTEMTKRSLGKKLGLGVLATLAAGAANAAPAANRPAGPAAPPRPNLPPAIAILAMVRSALLAVDHGNRTGNYTVLRDLAGPQFRDANNATRLSQIFGPLAAGGVDLLAVAVSDPIYAQPPAITPQGMIHVVGLFRIPPRAISFEILFEPVGPTWRIFAIGIQPA